MALIPCPDCGRQISTLAHSCPHCGAENKTKGTQKHGKGAHKEHGGMNESGKSAGKHDRSASINNERARKHKRMVRIVVLAGTIVVIMLGSGGWLWHHSRQIKAKEEASYNMLMENFSIADAKAFLANYPKTKHLKDIQDNLALYQKYEQEWTKIAGSTNTDDFAMFRSKYPNSPFDHKAYDKIDSLDWIYAKRSNTEGALRKYLDLHPDGKYAELAREQRQYIIDTRPTTEERDYATRVINVFLAALNDKNKEALNTITTAEMFIRGCDIIDSHDSGSTTNYTITSPVSVTKRPTSDGTIYVADYTVSRTSAPQGGASASNAEANKPVVMTIQAILNSTMQLSAITMTIKE